mmetsp:Transcript_3418/g.7065  ORF Transcript_3418/g.7065 Transcript_3418/m.7065 type:complete len:183 (+) Transcript_3418:64-612(+)
MQRLSISIIKLRLCLWLWLGCNAALSFSLRKNFVLLPPHVTSDNFTPVVLFGGAGRDAETTAGETKGGQSLPDVDAETISAGSDGTQTSLFVGVAQAKTTGILCVALALSQGAYVRGGGDPWAASGVAGFPPGGPAIVAVCIASGAYTLWKIQPVLAAVRASAEAQDRRRKIEALGRSDKDL